MKRSLVGMSVALLSIAPFGVWAQCQVVELEAPAAWVPKGLSLSPNGLVSGSLDSQDGQFSRPAVWAADGRLKTLLPHDPAFQVTVVQASNDRGVHVGWRKVFGLSQPQAVRWEQGSLIALQEGSPKSVNRHGVAVGHIDLSDGTSDKAVSWDATGAVSDLRIGRNNRSSNADHINRHGQMFGWVSDQFFRSQAVRWSSDGKPKPLPSLGGKGRDGFAFAGNDLGDAVGFSETTEFFRRATMWPGDSPETPIELGTLGGHMVPKAVNNKRVVVGDASLTTLESTAFVWAGGAMRDLNTMVPPSFLQQGNQLIAAYAVIDDGTILVTAAKAWSSRGVLLKRCLE